MPPGRARSPIPSLDPGPDRCRPARRRLLRAAPRHARSSPRAGQRARAVADARFPRSSSEEALFELEVLLKGLALLRESAEPPGPPRRAAIVAQDYREALALARDGMQRVVALCRAAPRRAGARLRLPALPRDAPARTTARARGSFAATRRQDTPEESLVPPPARAHEPPRGHGGVTRLPRVPFRLFYATLSVAHREVAQSAFFNPLAALEFRPEFDRITNVRVLELMRQVPGRAGAPARRAHVPLALPHASVRRAPRAASVARAASGGRRVPRARACCAPTRARSRTTCASRPASSSPTATSASSSRSRPRRSRARYEELCAEAHRLLAIKATLGGIAANVRLELRRAFEHDLPPADGGATTEQLRAAVATVAANLRPALQNAVLVLGKALGARLDEHGVFDDAAAKRSLSVRLRRDVWMFAQIVRAFAAKARAAPSREDRWSGPSSLQFVREFLSYFRAMGYPLLRAADYPRFDAFIGALSALEETDLLDPSASSARSARPSVLSSSCRSSSSRSAARRARRRPVRSPRRRRGAQALPRRLIGALDLHGRIVATQASTRTPDSP